MITFMSEKEKNVYVYVCVFIHFFSSDVFKVIIFNVRLLPGPFLMIYEAFFLTQIIKCA